MSESALRLAVLFPELLGTYGDGGNVTVLERRLRWRGFGCEVVRVSLGAPIPIDCDLYLLGGGEDDAQSLAMQGLRDSPGLTTAVARGATVFAVCAGLQLLGTTFMTTRGGEETGLGLLDVATRRRRVRAVGEVVALPEPDLAGAPENGLPALTGFENHGGGTVLGPAARPLARVVSGVGNGGVEDAASGGTRWEGAVQGGIVSTYLHGPVLARNPALADLLLTRATGSALPDLPSPPVEALRRRLLAAH
ncbi:MAG: glutamine amidotransferase [Actinomycetota bacterium]|nr:glutamine amidotransferase [Actinomycetota bacterium]